MLNGVSKLNLDVKGRLTIPSRYRERLMDSCAGHLITTLDPEKRIVIYPHNIWKEDIEPQLVQIPSMDKATRRTQRLYLGHAEDADMDKNGRINLQAYLREKAKLGKHVVLVGMGKKFELWDEDSWNREWDDDEDLELPEELRSLSL